MRNELVAQVELYRAMAERLGYIVPPIEVKFDLRGRAAGQAVYTNTSGKCVVRLNMEAYEQDAGRMLNQTIPHEVAHIVQFTNIKRPWNGGRKVRPHGPEWSHIMSQFGIPADRCHNLALTKARKVAKKYPYRCGCGIKHFTSIRHNRSQKWLLDFRSAQRPQYYQCGKCKQYLKHEH